VELLVIELAVEEVVVVVEVVVAVVGVEVVVTVVVAVTPPGGSRCSTRAKVPAPTLVPTASPFVPERRESPNKVPALGIDGAIVSHDDPS
jgi:hypothetical protein